MYTALTLAAVPTRGTMVELDDKQLLELYRSGQVDRMFNEMVRRFHSRIYWAARRMVKNHEDADDIAQEVFVRAYSALANFRGDSGIYTWLYRIAINLSINHLRKQKVRKLMDITDYIPFLGKDADQDAGMIHDENVTLIEKAIETLPEKQRAVFIMRYYDEMPYEQISAILGTSVGGLKANFHHAVKKVATYVKQHHGKLNLAGLEDDKIDDEGFTDAAGW
jgi:RNA polymerase sigma-70 factor (ECF subfamily)